MMKILKEISLEDSIGDPTCQDGINPSSFSIRREVNNGPEAPLADDERRQGITEVSNGLQDPWGEI
jgi:hypothetical protein